MAKKTAASANKLPPRRVYPYILWALAAGVWLMVGVALASYHPADPLPGSSIGGRVAPYNLQVHNLAGQFGATVSHHLYLMIGPGVWILMAGWLALLIILALRKPVSQPVIRFAGILLMGLSASALIGVHQPQDLSGGLIARAINLNLVYRFGLFGAYLILGVAFWIGAILAMDQVVLTFSRFLGQGLMHLRHVKWPKPVLVGRLAMPWSLGRGVKLPTDDSPLRLRPTGKARRKPDLDEEESDETAASTRKTVRGKPLADNEDPTPQVEAQADAPVEDAPGEIEDEPAVGDAPGAYLAERTFDPDALRAKIRQMPINFAPKGKAAPPPPREVDLSGYRFPGLDLLIEPESNFTAEMEKIVRDQAVQLEQALQQYRIDGEVVGIDSGPVITLYEVRLAPGTKVSQLQAISSDLARAMRSQNIRIVPNTVGKDTIGIEVPNQKKERVRLKELMTAHSDTVSRMQLPMFLGKDASGTPLIDDLTKMPHMLIAGTTGSGKSVCMNSIIMSFLYARRPDELKLVLVDPKMVELSMFKDIPHLMCPVVTEMSKATAILEWATTKMDERYELLAEAGVRDIAGYNALSWDELKERFQPSSESEEARIPKKLPYMVFIIDELADLMMTNKEVEGFIVRLAQKARAVGLHLILATQRPQANVVTGLIKGNMPCRISFKVASGLDSRIVLDQKGAELLLGQGDMLFLSPRSSKLVRAQGSLVDDGEIRKTVAFLRDIAEQNFEPQLMQLRAPSAEGESEEDMERDPLFDEAVRVVLETKRGSVSLLQRRLTIGYSRASRLIEQMAAAGMLGEYKGSQAREVTLTLEEWDAMKAQAEADAAQGTVFEKDAEESDDEDDAVPDEMDDEYRQ